MKFDAAAGTPGDLRRCADCGKPRGYKGYHGPECMCQMPDPANAPPTHSIKALRDPV